jgi:hypothetical protein
MNTAELSLHNVVSIVVGDRRFHGGNSDNPFWTRDIVITNDRGQSVTINMYSHSDDEDTALKVQS